MDGLLPLTFQPEQRGKRMKILIVEDEKVAARGLEKIPPPHFLRIQKSFIADSREIKEIHIRPGSKYEIELRNGIILPLSRRLYKELRNNRVCS